MTFDGAGNQARTISPALARTTYLWDGENRLSKVTLPTSVINTMTYNADSLRVQKQDSTGTTKSIWDGQNILLDANASNVTQALYSLNPQFFGKLLSQSRSGTSSFFQFDALGSTAALASSLGSVTDAYLFKAFGEAVDGSGSAVNPFRFAGRQGYVFDVDSSRYYVRARQYAPQFARWLSRDPIRFGGRSLYDYVSNRSTTAVDPSGLFNWCALSEWFDVQFGPNGDAWITCICGLVAIADIFDAFIALIPGGGQIAATIIHVLDCICNTWESYRMVCERCPMPPGGLNLGVLETTFHIIFSIADCALDLVADATSILEALYVAIADLVLFLSENAANNGIPNVNFLPEGQCKACKAIGLPVFGLC